MPPIFIKKSQPKREELINLVSGQTKSSTPEFSPFERGDREVLAQKISTQEPQYVSPLQRQTTPPPQISPQNLSAPSGVAPSPLFSSAPSPLSSPQQPPTASIPGEDTRQKLIDLIKKVEEQQLSALEAIKGQPTAESLFRRFREELKIPEKEQLLTAQTQRIQKTQELLDKLESDINARISGLGLIEAQRRRQLAVEQRPLVSQLAELARAAGITQADLATAQRNLQELINLAQADLARQRELALAPVALKQQLLPSQLEAMKFETPREKLEREIELKRRTKGFEAPGTVTTAQGIFAWNPETGRFDIKVGDAPRTATGIERMISEQGKRSELLGTISLVDELLGRDLSPITGRIKFALGFEGKYTKSLFDQLKSSLSLGKRQLLKGTGAISDFEAKQLEQAATALTPGLSEEDFTRELKKIRGIMSTAAGGTAVVKITDPKTKISQLLEADRNGIEQAILDGLKVEYQ